MKKLATNLALVLAAAICSIPLLAIAAGLNTYDGPTYTELLVPGQGAATSTSAAVNVSSRKGIGTFVLSVGKPAGASATYTNSIVVQHATTSNGTYAALSNMAGTAVALTVVSNAAGDISIIKCDTARMRQWIRAVNTVATDTGTASAVFLAY